MESMKKKLKKSGKKLFWSVTMEKENNFPDFIF